jgi:uncharacterized protein (DUF885 family)
MSTQEHRSAVFAFAHDLVDTLANESPLFAVELGIESSTEGLDDYSPAHEAAVLARTTRDLAALDQLEITDDVDRLAVEVMRERLSVTKVLIETGEERRTFTRISSPVGSIRQTFEMMPASTASDVEKIRVRLVAVAPSLATWRESINEVTRQNQLPSRRHIDAVADQALTHAQGSYVEFATGVCRSAGVDLDGSGMKSAALAAEAAAHELGIWLRDEVAPLATTVEASGLERYERRLLAVAGVTLDLKETYDWGVQDLARINARMWEVSEDILPGATSLAEVRDYLNNDPARRINGTDALLEKLLSFTATAVKELDGTHFDIDDRIKFCDARLAPAGSSAAAYYEAPSEDLSRPGTTWFPTMGETSFTWWNNASTWYHEAVPGHHLQCAVAVLATDRQSRFHRLAGWQSGYGEGWALYAERLMDELGYFTDPADELGHLCGQALRAARVVVDMGLHLGFTVPEGFGDIRGFGDATGQAWTPEMAISVLEDRALESHVSAASEVERYLGWPSQAITYKVGERCWLDIRESARQRLGAAYSNKAFHSYSLGLGCLGLDLFKEEMSRWDGRA